MINEITSFISGVLMFLLGLNQIDAFIGILILVPFNFYILKLEEKRLQNKELKNG